MKPSTASIGAVPAPADLAIEPRGTPRGRAARVLAHRGAGILAPENTLAAVRASVTRPWRARMVARA